MDDIYRSIQSADFETFKKLVDDLAKRSTQINNYIDPQEGYDIFYMVEDSNLDIDTKLKFLKYLFANPWAYNYVKGSLRLNRDKIIIKPGTGLYIKHLLAGEGREINKNEFDMLFDRVLDHLNYSDEKYEMLELVIRNSTKFGYNLLDTVNQLLGVYPDIDLYRSLPSWEKYGGLTPLRLAIIKDEFKFVEHLLQNFDDLTIVKKLVNEKESGRSLLHRVRVGNIEMLSLLLKYGINVNSQDNNGETYLIYLTEARGFERTTDVITTIKFLFDNSDLDLEIEDNEGNTALLIASIRSDEMFALLVELGANVNHQNKDGFTALMRTAYKGQHVPHIDNFRLLMALARVDFNLQNNSRNTALIVAILSTNTTLEVVEDLIEHTFLDIQNKDGNTALHLAFDDSIVEKIILNDANVDIVNNEGNTPLMININQRKKSRTRDYPIFDVNIGNLLNVGADTSLIDIEDLLPYYEYVVPNLENRLNDITSEFDKAELLYFERHCPKEFHVRKQSKEYDHLKHLSKCIESAQDMMKYKPGSSKEKALAQKYKEHEYFKRSF